MMDTTTAAPSTTETKRQRTPQPLHVASIPDALLTMKTASAVAGMSIATLYRKATHDPGFPGLVKIGARCTRVKAGPFMAWLASQGATTNAPEKSAQP